MSYEIDLQAALRREAEALGIPYTPYQPSSYEWDFSAADWREPVAPTPSPKPDYYYNERGPVIAITKKFLPWWFWPVVVGGGLVLLARR